MVSMWPWKGNDTSPASFEKALSTLSEKITKKTLHLDRLRQRARRLTVLWTLYSGFAYLLCSIILLLVVGWRKWGIAEYTGIASGPVVIYLVRLGLTTYYDYRTSNVQRNVDDLQEQREGTIKKLKAATKYDTTAELLKKYSGTPTPKAKETGDRKATPKQGGKGGSQNGRTSFVPPPTANIPGVARQSPGQGVPQPRTSPAPQQHSFPDSHHSRGQQQNIPSELSAEFAPNAFPAVPQYATDSNGPRWYDRFMDVLLGEDETLPGKRLALICNKCRLVNGQAPPGIKRLEDVGTWRCGGCGALNGKADDIKSLVESIQKEKARVTPAAPEEDSKATPDESKPEEIASPDEDEKHDSDVTVYTDEEVEEDQTRSQSKGENVDSPRRSARSTRGKKPT